MVSGADGKNLWSDDMKDSASFDSDYKNFVKFRECEVDSSY